MRYQAKFGNKMILARRSHLKFYKNTPLYLKVKNNNFSLYKSAGITIEDMRINEEKLPSELYIKKEYKIKSIQEAQKGFNRELELNIKQKNPVKIKETLVTIMQETFEEPRSGSLEGLSNTINILISADSRQFDVVKRLLNISFIDYTTVLHSINVMAFSLVYAFYTQLDIHQTKSLGLSALLHDVGKTKIDQNILKKPRSLTNEEFEEIKKHSIIGYNILKRCKFTDKNICLVALEHHEKLDGSGYPHGKKQISEAAQIIGIIDCYEALTNNERPYRNAMIPIDTLTLIKDDVAAGKFNKNIFEKFAYSLVEK